MNVKIVGGHGFVLSNFSLRPDGEIGKHARLKIWCLKRLAGSNPARAKKFVF